MWEFEILLNSGKRELIHGRKYEDALRRHKLSASQVKTILFQEYVD